MSAAREPTDAEHAWIMAWIDRWLTRSPGCAVEPPEAMRGEDLGGGWYAWAPVPSTLSPSALTAFEDARLGTRFPPLFRAFALSRAVLAIETRTVRLPDLPSDDPLGPLERIVRATRVLIEAGYLPFGSDGDDVGPLCFDSRARGPDGDCPVVCIDHERFGDGSRAALERAATTVAPSFRALLERMEADAIEACAHVG